MTRRFREALIGIAALLAMGCGPGMYAPQRVTWYLNTQQDIWLRTEKADFAVADVTSATPTTHGSNLLQSAAQLQPSVAQIVLDYGVPDALRVKWTGSTYSVHTASLFELAYLSTGEIVYFDPSIHRLRRFVQPIRVMTMNPDGALRVAEQRTKPLELPGPPEPPYSRRRMESGERAAIDPDLALRMEIEAWARVLRVGRKVALALEDRDIAESAREMAVGYVNNFVTVAVTPESARLFGEPLGQPGRYIAWVDPDGPHADILEVGWRLVAIDGQPPQNYDPSLGGAPAEFVLHRDGSSRTVTVTPERWPLDIRFYPLSVSNQSAFVFRGAKGAYVGIAEPFLDLHDSDDQLAITLGHEVAHAALGHLTPPSTPEKVLRLGWMMTAGIVSLPLAAGVLNRFDRDAERHADIEGLRLAHRAGYDARVGVSLIDMFEEQRSMDIVTQFLAKHPSYDERRRVFRDEAKRLRDGVEPARLSSGSASPPR